MSDCLWTHTHTHSHTRSSCLVCAVFRLFWVSLHFPYMYHLKAMDEAVVRDMMRSYALGREADEAAAGAVATTS